MPDAIRNAGQSRRRPPASTQAHSRASRCDRPVEDPARQLERELDERARASGILFAPPGPASEPAEPELGVRAAPAEAEAPGATASLAPAAVDPNLQDRKNAFLNGKGGVKEADYLAATIQHPRSPYEIKAGTILPAVLITAINSDLPGPVVAQVREHVYDTVTGDHLLVPQGSRLIAQYDSMVAWGQERVLLCWNRLILPNGDSIDLAVHARRRPRGRRGPHRRGQRALVAHL